MMNLSPTTSSNQSRINSRPNLIAQQRTGNLETEAMSEMEKVGTAGLDFVLKKDFFKNLKLEPLKEWEKQFSWGTDKNMKAQTGTYVNPQGQENKVTIEYNNTGDVWVTLENYRLSKPLTVHHQISSRGDNFTEFKVPLESNKNAAFTLDPKDQGTKEDYKNLSELIEAHKKEAGYKTRAEGGFD